MVKTNSSIVSRKRHKKLIKSVKGYVGRANNCYRIAIQRRVSGFRYSYVSRRIKNRYNRTSSITKISLFIRTYGITYSELIKLFKSFDLQLNRKQILLLLSENNILNFIADKIKSIHRVSNI